MLKRISTLILLFPLLILFHNCGGEFRSSDLLESDDLNSDSSIEGENSESIEGKDLEEAFDATAKQFLCRGLKSTSRNIGLSNISPPGYLKGSYDPNFGVNIVRITGKDSQWPNPRVRHHYNSEQAWNADGSLIWLRKGQIMIDAKTLKPIPFSRPRGNWVEKWSPTEPNIMFFFKENILYKYDVRTGVSYEVMNAPGYTDLRMEVRTNPSNDGLVIGAKAIRQSDNKSVCLLLDLKNKSLSKPVLFEEYGFTRSENKSKTCAASPTGKYMLLSGMTPDYTSNNLHIFDWDGHLIRRMNQNDGIECPGHSDVGIDHNGDGIVVGVCKGGRGRLSQRYAGNTISFRIRDGGIRVLGPRFSHVSCRNTQRNGVCFGSTFASKDATVAAIKTNGSGIEWITNTYSYPHNDDYFAQPHAVPSPDGTKIIFAGNWNGTFNKVHTFLVDFKKKCEVH